MNSSLTATATKTIDASAPNVWRALTDPAIVKQYFYGTELATDWRVGSHITFSGEYNGQQYQDKGIVREYIDGKRLQYTYFSSFSGLEDTPENYSLVTISIDGTDSETTITVVQQGFKDEQARDHAAGEQGWSAVLDGLKQIVEET